MSAEQIDQKCVEEDFHCEEEWVAPPPSTIAESIDVGRELRLLKTLVDFKCGDTPRPPFRYPKPIGPWQRRKRKTSILYRPSYNCPFRIRLLARPLERHILLTLENYGHLLPAHVVEAMRRSIGDEPTFTPKEAYGFFKQMHRKRKIAERHILLSNVILHELCGYMKMLTPCRDDPRPKQQFMMEIADRITAWIDQILVDAGLRMLFVDADEDDDISTEDEEEENQEVNEEVNGEEVDGEEVEHYMLADEQLPEAEYDIQEDDNGTVLIEKPEPGYTNANVPP